MLYTSPPPRDASIQSYPIRLWRDPSFVQICFIFCKNVNTSSQINKHIIMSVLFVDNQNDLFEDFQF